MYTLEQLQDKVKRRLRQLVSTTSASVEAETGFIHSNLAITDAINAGRSKVGSVIVKAGYYVKQLQAITTVTDTQDYNLDMTVSQIESVIYNYVKDASPASAVQMLELVSASEEMDIINDNMYSPSVTEPYYRVVGDASIGVPEIHIITSRDGTVNNGDKIHIEYRGDLPDLDNATPSGQSNLSHELDHCVVEWALHILTETLNVQASAQFKQVFYDSMQMLNGSRR